ncbi:MAG: GNAT family N-acetyltransferase [Roseitalea porphyridii]|jgi:RimJ/RimL family protein N-acetyltransferase|uniref:GNAT family N-acetyltransferase n=1 Tax=Roseitalea porphyridii TaxID=1852022 RepID=UPI0032EB4CD4
MKADTEAITIRPVTKADLPMLAQWLARDHVRQWWGDVDTQIGRLRAKLDGRDSTRPFIFELEGAPAGYVQYSFFDDDRTPAQLAETPWLDLLPNGAVGIDLFIAEAGSLSKGLGSAVVRLMAEMLWQKGHRLILIDPDATNTRAVRAYEKAGFHPVDDLQGRTDNYLIMRFDPAISQQGGR